MIILNLGSASLQSIEKSLVALTAKIGWVYLLFHKREKRNGEREKGSGGGKREREGSWEEGKKKYIFTVYLRLLGRDTSYNQAVLSTHPQRLRGILVLWEDHWILISCVTLDKSQKLSIFSFFSEGIRNWDQTMSKITFSFHYSIILWTITSQLYGNIQICILSWIMCFIQLNW